MIKILIILNNSVFVDDNTILYADGDIRDISVKPIEEDNENEDNKNY